MNKQLGFLIDLNRCLGCHSCEFSCKNKNHLDILSYRKVLDLKRRNNVVSFLSMACNHCADPQCIRVCPKNCYQKLRNGIVLHEPVDCEGCKSCIGACPFEVPKYNHATKKISKCNLCISRLREGLPPACVSSCISEALQLVDINVLVKGDYEKTIPNYPIILFTNPSIRFILPREPRCSWVSQEEGGIEL